MSTHDNAPPPPDWKPSPGNTCGSCLAHVNLCVNVYQVSDNRCCSDCTHLGEIVVLVWDGDQA